MVKSSTAATGTLWLLALNWRGLPVNSFSPACSINTAWKAAPCVLQSSNDDNEGKAEPSKQKNPDIVLQPFLPALDPLYPVSGALGEEDFIVSRSGPPRDEELTDENLLKIVYSETNDLEVNTLVWKCLGYRFDEENECWTDVECFPKWKNRFPLPPDFVGMQRVYSKDVDLPVLTAIKALTATVPTENKVAVGCNKAFKAYGFTGYQFAELTPNKTRRAQCTSWILYYREELKGYTVEELKERRRLKKEAAESERKRLEEEGKGPKDGDWKYPLKEVY